MSVACDQDGSWLARRAQTQSHVRIAGPLGKPHAGQRRFGQQIAMPFSQGLIETGLRSRRQWLCEQGRQGLIRREYSQATAGNLTDLDERQIGRHHAQLRIQRGLHNRLIDRPIRPALPLPSDRGSQAAGILRMPIEIRSQRGLLILRQHLHQNHGFASSLRHFADQAGLDAVMTCLIVLLADQDIMVFGEVGCQRRQIDEAALRHRPDALIRSRLTGQAGS